jgi:hypothetical protein
MVDELAAIEGTPAEIAAAIRTAALYGEGNDPHEEMYIRVDDECIETPASAADATQTSYCTLHNSGFDSIRADEPVKALFPVAELLGWLAWFDADVPITIELLGEPGAEVITAFDISNGGRSVRIPCIDNPAILSDVKVWLPDRFDAGRFLDENGDPLPTTIETTISEVERLVDAADRCEGIESYPLIVQDGDLRIELDGENVSVAGHLKATVDGPNVRNQYGAGFARIVRGIDGEVELQTAPGGDLVFVQETEHARLRYYVAHRPSE